MAKKGVRPTKTVEELMDDMEVSENSKNTFLGATIESNPNSSMRQALVAAAFTRMIHRLPDVINSPRKFEDQLKSVQETIDMAIRTAIYVGERFEHISREDDNE